VRYSRTKSSAATAHSDWVCTQCAKHNFSYRQKCFNCSASVPEESKSAIPHVQDHTSVGARLDSVTISYPSPVVALRNLDTLVTVDAIAEQLDDASLVDSVHVVRDGQGVSLGVAFLSFQRTEDAASFVSMHGGQENGQSAFLDFMGKRSPLSFVSHIPADLKNPRPATTRPGQGSGPASSFVLEAVQQAMAQRQGGSGGVNTQHQAPQTAIPQHGIASSPANIGTVDLQDFTVQDPQTGMYFNPKTQMYYDPKSYYFYSTVTQQYMVWDAASQSLVVAAHPQIMATPAGGTSVVGVGSSSVASGKTADGGKGPIVTPVQSAGVVAVSAVTPGAANKKRAVKKKKQVSPPPPFPPDATRTHSH